MKQKNKKRLKNIKQNNIYKYYKNVTKTLQKYYKNITKNIDFLQKIYYYNNN